jgi:anaerobic selenocysteine-containing dehydrogenase
MRANPKLDTEKAITELAVGEALVSFLDAKGRPEMVERACGSPKDKFLEVCKLLGSCANPHRVATVLYALGWCHHSVGSQNVRIGAMVQLLMGNIGEAGGGTQALRGHSNVQGLTDLGLLSGQLPGYLTLPTESEQDYGGFISARTKKPLLVRLESRIAGARAAPPTCRAAWRCRG